MAQPRVSHRRRLVDHPAPTPQSTPCRLWQGALSGKGYGIRPDHEYTHRWVVRTIGFDQFGVPWSDELHSLHLCDQPLCFRYNHLFLGTNEDNRADMFAKRRHSHGETHRGAKLTDTQVAELRARYASGGVMQKDLAAEYGVGKMQVSRLVRGLRRTLP